MLTFQKLTSKDDPLFDKAFAIYEESFPSSEKRTLETHLEALLNKDFNCDICLDDEELVGILFYWKYDKTVYIEHLAISPQLRGKHYGTRILNAFCTNYTLSILEIEPPTEGYTLKRLEFYQKCGFKMNDYPHTQLPYRKNEEPIILTLLSYPRLITQAEYEAFEEYFLRVPMGYREEI